MLRLYMVNPRTLFLVILAFPLALCGMKKDPVPKCFLKRNNLTKKSIVKDPFSDFGPEDIKPWQSNNLNATLIKIKGIRESKELIEERIEGLKKIIREFNPELDFFLALDGYESKAGQSFYEFKKKLPLSLDSTREYDALLFEVIESRWYEAVELLLERRVNPNIQDGSLRTPLHCCCDGKIDLMPLFIKYGAKLDDTIYECIIDDFSKLFSIKPKKGFFASVGGLILQKGNANSMYDSHGRISTIKKVTKAAFEGVKKFGHETPQFKTKFLDILKSKKLDDKACFAIAGHDSRFLSIVHDWGFKLSNYINVQDHIVSNGINLGELMEHGIDGAQFIKMLLHDYNVPIVLLEVQDDNGNTMLHALAQRIEKAIKSSQSTFTVSGTLKLPHIMNTYAELDNVPKKGLPSDNGLACMLLMMQKRKECNVAKMPRRLLIYLIKKFGNDIWKNENFILTKQLLSIKNKEEKMACDIVYDVIHSMEQEQVKNNKKQEDTMRMLKSIAYILDSQQRN